MRESLRARVILLDGEGRILLMKGRLPSDPTAPGAWFTVGGGVDPGETLAQAAAREIVEETGLTDARLGQVVAYGETAYPDGDNEPLLFKQTYFVAWTAGGATSRDGWLPHEHDLVDDMRWWTVADLAACREAVYPLELRAMLPDLVAGRLPATPIVIAYRDPAKAT